MVSDTRIYASAIALASGVYSLWSASTASRPSTVAWVMGVLGLIVIVHGATLLTEYADALGSASGPLMVGYALVMLLIQAVSGTGMVAGPGMGMGGRMDGGVGMTAAGWDLAMVLLALLMLTSGLVMRRPGGTGRDSGRM